MIYLCLGDMYSVHFPTGPILEGYVYPFEQTRFSPMHFSSMSRRQLTTDNRQPINQTSKPRRNQFTEYGAKRTRAAITKVPSLSPPNG